MCPSYGNKEQRFECVKKRKARPWGGSTHQLMVSTQLVPRDELSRTRYEPDSCDSTRRADSSREILWKGRGGAHYQTRTTNAVLLLPNSRPMEPIVARQVSQPSGVPLLRGASTDGNQRRGVAIRQSGNPSQTNRGRGACGCARGLWTLVAAVASRPSRASGPALHIAHELK